MARLLDSDDIINIINQEHDRLGFYLLEVADKISGYRICAVMEAEVGGHTVQIIFRQDVIHLSRYYDRDEVGGIIEMLSTISGNIKRVLNA